MRSQQSLIENKIIPCYWCGSKRYKIKDVIWCPKCGREQKITKINAIYE